jgi:3-hydroxyisobutyrate dehydrogenase-like beta-hydroxyacid dehydrogenase
MKITFIGLGKMGSAMVKRLLQSSYEVTVFNRTPSKMIPLQALGAKPSESIAQAVSQADIVMTCLLNDKALLEVAEEMVSHIQSKAIHIGLSTILPDTAQAIEDLHQKKGGYYISATVLGIPAVADHGQLTTFCAGAEPYLEIAIPILKAFSGQIVALGNETKAPNIMKICMNYSLMTTLELISELYTFAEKSGLDTEIVRKGLHQIYAHPSFKLYIDKIHARDFDHVNFNMLGGNKDVSIFQEAFSRVGVAPEIGNIVKSRFISALSLGMENKDWSGIYEVIRAQSGLK